MAVTGTMDELAAVVAEARRRGVLAAASDVQPTGQPGVFLLNARLVERQAPVLPPVPARRRSPSYWWAAAGALALVLLGVAAWALTVAAAWLAAHAAELGGVALLVGVLLLVAGPRACQTTVKVTHRH